MGIIEVLLTSFGLAGDAFAVSICKGLSFKKFSLTKAILVGFYFGIFQGIMPLFGYFLGIKFKDLIISVDHWVAFCLLSIIGLGMLREGFSKDVELVSDKVDFKEMLPLAIATSIDALAIGITFSFLKVNIISSILLIVFITFCVSLCGVFLGNKIGDKYHKKSQVLGGLILVFIGVKILINHILC